MRGGKGGDACGVRDQVLLVCDGQSYIRYLLCEGEGDGYLSRERSSIACMCVYESYIRYQVLLVVSFGKIR